MSTSNNSNDKKKSFNVFAMMTASQVPVITSLIEHICEDYADKLGDTETIKTEMMQKYISKSEKDCKKMWKKVGPKNRRARSGYTIFLADPVIVEEIKAENDGKQMKRLNGKKGQKWKSLSSEEIEHYNLVATLINNKLIDDKPENLKETIRLWMHNKTLKDAQELAKQIPEKPKKVKKPRKKTVKKVEKKQESDDESDEESISISISDDEMEGSDNEEEPEVEEDEVVSDYSDSESDSESSDLEATQAI